MEVPEAEALQQLAQCLSLDARDVTRARSALRRARSLPLAPIHGDVHEGQILVDPQDGLRVTGVIDWQTAAVDHPFAELDFREWGPTIWREHRTDFPALRTHFFRAYAAGRSLDPALEPVFEWVHAASLALDRRAGTSSAHGPETVGTLYEAAAVARAATAQLPD